MKNIFRTLGYGIVIYIVFSFLINLIKLSKREHAYCDEYSQVNPFTKDAHHFRYWRLGDKRGDFCTDYESIFKLSEERSLNRTEMVLDEDDYHNFWGTVYMKLVAQSHGDLDFIADSLLNISTSMGMDASTLAELTVSFIQDIPYSYVLGDDCGNRNTQGFDCIGNQAYGILSPYEFLHTLYGDCDTRAVLLYAILQKMNFDPMIVVSDEYAHAMLALNIPSSGDYIEHGKKKYYFWETTGAGWPIGMLPPDCSNVNYWKIALVNEL
ncbi:hypothetical protein [Marinoscillum sp. MHG1-6]|uniref:hypothetical protein n=1 Tax=Marinoscillum sp. MHG1-6 TaxID=2959627 RepID=UPI0021585157|nr:hypothetical protein [Marinoscillum sp. MHG1-6]